MATSIPLPEDLVTHREMRLDDVDSGLPRLTLLDLEGNVRASDGGGPG